MKEKNMQKAKEAAVRVDAFFIKHPFVFLLICAALICFVVESLGRHSLFLSIRYIFTRPLMFLYNSLIVLCTLSPVMLLRKRYVYLTFVSAIWLALGITNCVVLGYRITPIGFIDIALMDSVWGIIDIYLELWQLILISVAIVAVLALGVYMWKKLPRHRVAYIKSLCFIATVSLVTYFSTLYGVSAQALPEDFGNLAEDYSEYGFAYCFSRSVVDRGVDEPKNYGEDAVRELLSLLPDDNAAPAEKPNVIFLQLESFFDVNNMINLTYSENPTPSFTALKESYPHGTLSVPSLGAGTANTEFEILTGMNISHFGAGEYPYKTILKDQTAESMAYNYSALGYTTHALHNHSGTFYDRNTVYASLGFDTFTSLEYMRNVEENPLGWAKDKVLTSHILDALASSEGRDFIYAVSVQAHGKYPREVIDENQRITLEGFADEKMDIAFEYYVNQISEEDAFLGELICALGALDEPVVLVLYGDHLPGFEISSDELSGGSVFETEYVIWSNYGLELTDAPDLETYELSAYVMEILGYNEGIFTKFHQTYRDSEDYDALHRLLEFDTLYGYKYAYGGENPHIATDMKMGVKDIFVTDADNMGESCYIRGDSFTTSSIVYINGRKKDTAFIDAQTLYLPSETLERGDIIAVAQVGTDGVELSYTEEYIYGDLYEE